MQRLQSSRDSISYRQKQQSIDTCCCWGQKFQSFHFFPNRSPVINGVLNKHNLLRIGNQMSNQFCQKIVFFFLVTFLCNLAWQPVNKTFIKHYHIDAVLSWPTSLFLNIYIASFVPIVHSQSRFQICIRVVLKSTWSCPRTVKKVSRS